MLDFLTRDFPLYAWSVRMLDRRLRHFDIFFSDGAVKVDHVMKAFETEPNGPNVENFRSWKSDCVTLGKL